MNILKRTTLKLLTAPTTANTGATTGDTFDASGCDGIVFIGMLGTQGATATASLQIHESSASTSGFDALTGAVAATTAGESDKMQVIEIHRPLKRYYRAILTRGSTDTTEYGGILALGYSLSKVPSTHSSTSLSGGAVVLVASPTT